MALHLHPLPPRLGVSGVVIGESARAFDAGRWHITGDGRFCRVWNVWERARLRGFHVDRDDERVELRPDDRWYVTRFRLLPAP